MIFPGQGVQSLKMLANFAQYHPEIRKTFDEASDYVRLDLWKLTQQGPLNQLNMTQNTQPIVLSASIAIWKVWKKMGGKTPYIVAGHSLGEYSALVCSKVLKFSDAVCLVRIRGKIMQNNASNQTGRMMAIIGIPNRVIKKICMDFSHIGSIFVSCWNGFKQTVVSGNTNAIEKLRTYLVQYKHCKTFILPVNTMAHCELMHPSSSKFEKILRKTNFFLPKIRLLNNVDVKIEKCPLRIKNALVRQMHCPVRWNEIVQCLVRKKIKLCLEVSPGNTLTRLNRCVRNKMYSASLNTPEALDKILTEYF